MTACTWPNCLGPKDQLILYQEVCASLVGEPIMITVGSETEPCRPACKGDTVDDLLTARVDS